MKINIIYLAENIINNKKYIGRTDKNLSTRKRYHFWETKRESNTIFHKAIKKYGKENFKWTIIKECKSWEEAGIMETFMIIIHHTHKDEGGYNLTWGNDGGDTFTYRSEESKNRTRKKLSKIGQGKKHKEETIKRCSEIKLGEKNPMYGKKHTSETRKKISESSKNRLPISEETRRKISIASKGRNIGRKHTDEELKKMSISMKGRIPWNKGKTYKIKNSGDNYIC